MANGDRLGAGNDNLCPLCGCEVESDAAACHICADYLDLNRSLDCESEELQQDEAKAPATFQETTDGKRQSPLGKYEAKDMVQEEGGSRQASPQGLRHDDAKAMLSVEETSPERQSKQVTSSVSILESSRPPTDSILQGAGRDREQRWKPHQDSILQGAGCDREQRWKPAQEAPYESQSGVGARKKTRTRRGRIVVIYLLFRICINNYVPSPLSLEDHDIYAFRRLFEINKFQYDCMREHTFYFRVGSRNSDQVQYIINQLKYQIKNILFRMCKGEIVGGREVKEESDILCNYEYIEMDITHSVYVGRISKTIWRIEF